MPKLPRTVYIKGVQRSGTTLAEKWLFNQHFCRHVRFVAAGKHHAFSPEPGVHSSDRLLFIIAKHPLEWVGSAHRWWVKFYSGVGLDWSKCTERNTSLEEFVVKERPVRHWSSLNKSWLEADPAPASRLVLRYGEVISAPGTTIARVASWLGLNRPGQPHVYPLPGFRYNPNTPMNLRYYTDEEYLREITPRIRRVCAEDADPDVLRGLGFTSG